MLIVIFEFVMSNVVITLTLYPLLTVSCKYTLILFTVLNFGSVLASLVGMKSKDKLNTDSINNFSIQ